MTRHKERAAIYLAAMIDGEGSVSYRENLGTVIITNTDVGIIEAIKSHLNTLAIIHRVQTAPNQKNRYTTCYSVWIGRQSEVVKLASYVLPHMWHEGKKSDLDLVCLRQRLRDVVIA